MLAEHEGESGTRFTYDGGTLEILVPSARHEKPNRILASLMEVLAEEMALNIESLGSTTLKRPDLLKGFEPASCFYIQHADAIRDIDVQVCFWKLMRLAGGPSHFLRSSAQTALRPRRHA